MDEARFRAALGGFLTGVTVIAVRDDAGRPAGFTASSFTSVSLEPPLVLFCLGRDASIAPVFLDARSFAVSILRADQAALAQRFAEADEPFAGAPWTAGETGAPILDQRLGAIECDVEKVVEGGDHHVFFGRVRRADWDEDAEPLGHFRGGYRTLGPLG
jgi:flavin reductase (DIM6/NTAB) family NADH-FMN oxidoreductase RutF